MVEAFDCGFDFDVYSCRKNKGLLAAIKRTQTITIKLKNYFVWRADIEKFFDCVDHQILAAATRRRITDKKTIWLIEEIISSYRISQSTEREGESRLQTGGVGIPIGNLTSQILANVYLNELDRYVRHHLKPKAYLRYGDDFIIFESDLDKLKQVREDIIEFTANMLKLRINSKNDALFKARHGVNFLGVRIFPQSRKLSQRNIKRIDSRVCLNNLSSYWGLIKQHQPWQLKEFNWKITNMMNDE